MKRTLLLIFVFVAFYFGNLSAQCDNHTVPHFEGFSGINTNNQIPTCWAISSSVTCLTFTTGSAGNFAGFYYSPGGQSYFYSPGFYLKAGSVYSVSAWYQLTTPSNSGWTNIGILIGTSQSATGLQPIVSQFPSAISYAPVGGTLTVSSDGNYFFAVTASNNGNGASQHLLWDDFLVELPCSLNAPPITVFASQATVCTGDPVVLTAAGADTYTWSTGDQGNTATVTPNFPGNQSFTVTGTGTLSGCASATVQTFMANPTPNVSAYANPPVICRGKKTTLSALGTSYYVWDFGGLGAAVDVTPTATRQYTVTGVNQYGCWSDAVTTVIVNQLPNVAIADMPPGVVCAFETSTLTPSGANSYTLVVGSEFYFGNPMYVKNPIQPEVVELTGIDANGCVNTFTATLYSTICGALGEDSPTAIHLFPNPGAAIFYLENVIKGTSFRLFNETGNEFALRVEKDTVGRYYFDLNDLCDGVYILLVDNKPIRVLKNSH